ncbi:hypothetical protein D039_2265A, partial [Vibrio parahaemolyticus EKP-028]
MVFAAITIASACSMSASVSGVGAITLDWHSILAFQPSLATACSNRPAA